MCTNELLDAAWVPLDQVDNEKYPISPVGNAIMSVVHDGLKDGFDKVSWERKKWEWTAANGREYKFSFYRK